LRSEQSPQVINNSQIRTLTIAACTPKPDNLCTTTGIYIREPVRLGLGLGWENNRLSFSLALAACKAPSRLAKPTEQSFQRLKQFTADASHEPHHP